MNRSRVGNGKFAALYHLDPKKVKTTSSDTENRALSKIDIVKSSGNRQGKAPPLSFLYRKKFAFGLPISDDNDPASL